MKALLARLTVNIGGDRNTRIAGCQRNHSLERPHDLLDPRREFH